jgi:hypothetical protein
MAVFRVRDSKLLMGKEGGVKAFRSEDVWVAIG